MPHQDPLVAEARSRLQSSHHAILSTLSTYLPGWPFGSVTPFALTKTLEPILSLSNIAEHSKNLAADDRASLLCLDPDATDKQASWRLTLLGRLRRAAEHELAELEASYLARFPDAAGQSRFHDFHFYRLSVVAVRFIAGFGSMGWLPVSEVLEDPDDPLADERQGAIEHMNADHRSALEAYVEGFFGLKPEDVTMTQVNSSGLDLETTVRGRRLRLRVPFERPVRSAEELRAATVSLVRQARSQIRQP